MPNLEHLPAFDDDGNILVVVEAPKGCAAKLQYDPELKAFVLGKPLPLGLTYPFDWGFVPGTEADDGDPVDALVLLDLPTFPGVVIPCRPVGVVQLEQNGKKKKQKKHRKRERNDRLVLVPSAMEREDREELPERLRAEIQRFFLNTTFFTSKDAEVIGWGDAAEALALVKRSLTKK
jgi:inorganic pyrophosphatase